MAVNKARVRLFVEALRSKRFRQTNGTLALYDSTAKKVKYCCLGVACEVARNAEDGLDLPRTRDGKHYLYGKEGTSDVKEGTSDVEFSFLPKSVREWFGFDGDNPELIITMADMEHSKSEQAKESFQRHDDSPYRGSATGANDSWQLPFSAIADAFERTYLDGDIES